MEQFYNQKLCKKKNPDIEIAATRKTTPGFRKYEKKAVCIGGGTPHRMGLYDGILIKDNHLVGLSIREAIRKSRSVGMKVEIEVESTEDAIIAAEEGANIIMLDNMSCEEMKQAVEIAGGRIPLEASGNVNLETITDIAATGVNYISVGEITHSARAVDLSMLIERAE